MTNQQRALGKFMSDRQTGEIRRGALARVAEHLGVHKSTVVRWLSGEWKPGDGMRDKIRSMIADGLDLSARVSPGRPRKNKNKIA